MIDVSSGAERECGAEKVDCVVNIAFDGLGETA
jgi:hypothetical protein